MSQQWVVSTGIVPLCENFNAVSIYVIDVEDWRHPLIDYIEHNKIPNDLKQRTDIKRRAPSFFYYKETLYRRSFDELLLRCLGKEEASKAMEEVHSGVCGAHQSGPKLHFQVRRMSYY